MWHTDKDSHGHAKTLTRTFAGNVKATQAAGLFLCMSHCFSFSVSFWCRWSPNGFSRSIIPPAPAFFFVTKDRMVSIRRPSRWKTTWRTLKGIKRLVHILGFWVTYKVLFKVVLMQMYSHTLTLLWSHNAFSFPSLFCQHFCAQFNSKTLFSNLNLNRCSNKCLNPDYEREIHHLFKGRDRKC